MHKRQRGPNCFVAQAAWQGQGAGARLPSASPLESPMERWLLPMRHAACRAALLAACQPLALHTRAPSTAQHSTQELGEAPTCWVVFKVCSKGALGVGLGPAISAQHSARALGRLLVQCARQAQQVWQRERPGLRGSRGGGGGYMQPRRGTIPQSCTVAELRCFRLALCRAALYNM